jgi:hypothetical protein
VEFLWEEMNYGTKTLANFSLEEKIENGFVPGEESSGRRIFRSEFSGEEIF